MERITIDVDLERQLRSTDRPVELVDQHGNVLGRCEARPGRLPQAVLDACPLSDEELAERTRVAQKEGGRPLSEILAELPAE